MLVAYYFFTPMLNILVYFAAFFSKQLLIGLEVVLKYYKEGAKCIFKIRFFFLINE